MFVVEDIGGCWLLASYCCFVFVVCVCVCVCVCERARERGGGGGRLGVLLVMI